MNRTEHLQWVKERALYELENYGTLQAYMSLLSDLNKHSETQGHTGIELGNQLLLAGHLSSEKQMRDFIEGFN